MEESQLLSNLIIIQSFHHHEDASLTLWALLKGKAISLFIHNKKSIEVSKQPTEFGSKKATPTMYFIVWKIDVATAYPDMLALAVIVGNYGAV